MSELDFWVFLMALSVAAASPGPGLATLVGLVLSGGACRADHPGNADRRTVFRCHQQTVFAIGGQFSHMAHLPPDLDASASHRRSEAAKNENSP